MKNPLGAMVRQVSARARYSLPMAVCGLAVLVLFSGMAQAYPSADGTHRKGRKATPAPPVEPAPVVVLAPPPPPPPLTPGQMPANAPNVSFQDGLLTISAENSTLSDILSAVSARTGATMDVPSGAGADRVWVTLGPGPARAILAALLSGTSLDYVIQASDADQTQIQSVLLTPRNKGGKTGDTSGGGTQSFASRYRQSRTRPSFGAADSSDSDNGSAPDVSTGTPDSDAGVSNAAASSPQPSSPADAQQAAVDTPATSTPSPALSARLPLSITEMDAHPVPVANPEQAIPQMQNLFELRRQLQEQQNAQQKAAIR